VEKIFRERAGSSFSEEFADSFKFVVGPERFGDLFFIARPHIGSYINRIGQGIARRRWISRFSHVAICLRPGLWMDARPGFGVSAIPSFEIWRYLLRPGKNFVAQYRPPIEDDVLERVLSGTRFAIQSYKNPYNFIFFAHE